MIRWSPYHVPSFRIELWPRNGVGMGGDLVEGAHSSLYWLCHIANSQPFLINTALQYLRNVGQIVSDASPGFGPQPEF